ncbi:MAG: choice-of-anchor I family protein [Ruminiclostridium sp.]
MNRLKRILSCTVAAAITLSAVYASAWGGASAEGADASDIKISGFNNGKSTLDVQLTARYNSGVMDADGGCLEIVEYNEKNGYAYAVSGVKGNIIAVKISDVGSNDKVTELSGTEYDVKALLTGSAGIDGFVYGDTTSVAISPDGKKLAASVQHADYDKNGAVAVFDCDSNGNLTDPVLYSTGVQPDMVVFADSNTILTADEGEPRNGYADAADPAGTVTVISLSDNKSVSVGFENFTADELIGKNIIVGVNDGEKIAPVTDLEPEYIAVSSDGSTAYVALQEANAIAVLDIAAKTFTDIYSAGYQDFGTVPVDIVEDGGYNPKTYENLVGARMPDGIAVYENGGKTYVIAANEGDAREWGDYCNEVKTKAITKKNIRVLDAELCAGLPEGKTVMFGGRSFTIYEVKNDGLEVVYDSGSDFERISAEYLPDYFNCSNNDVKTDSRSVKKGPEPENVTIGTVQGKTYAFIAIERIGGVMIYDITDPADAQFVNYINSREFDEDIKGDVSPEGICFVKGTGTSNPMVLASCEVSGTLAVYELHGDDHSLKVLYTNDIHNAFEKADGVIGYAAASQYKKQLEAQGYNVLMIDAGDAVQGGVIGTLSNGEYIVRIMEQAGYDIAVPGNHEFDFGMDNFLTLAENAEYDYICCNFIDLRTGKTVFDPYRILEIDGKKYGFIGIATPETYTKSTPTYFMDESGNYIYGFCNGDNGNELYRTVQNTIDEVKAQGADYIIAIGHTGIDISSKPWTSSEIIANTDGLDAYIDGHSHSVIESDRYTDKGGKEVLVTSTGTKFAYLGEMNIGDDKITSALISGLTEEDPDTLAFVNGIKDEFEELTNTVVASSDVLLAINDPKTGDRLIRSQETNLGDLCADAYLAMSGGADIAFVNGGGIRVNIEKGDITYGDIISVHPFGNKLCVIEVTGQQVLDALEFGSRAVGAGELGGFLQVAGLTYEINAEIPSSVVTDENGMFVKVGGEYRVRNVTVGGEPLDLNKTYKLASHNYMLKSAGDGYSMFKDCKLLLDEIMIDNQVLINYITRNLDGRISADSIYADPYGEGRIKIITKTVEATCTEDGYIEYLQGADTLSEVIPATGHNFGEWETTAEPTADKDGEKKRTCSICGETETEIIQMTGEGEPADAPTDDTSSQESAPSTDVISDTTSDAGEIQNPTTGENAGGLISMAVIAIIAAGSMAAVSRKRK